MGHKKAVKLLNQNLKEEQQTLKKMESFSKKLKPENLGMGEEEEEGRRATTGPYGPWAESQRSLGVPYQINESAGMARAFFFVVSAGYRKEP